MNKRILFASAALAVLLVANTSQATSLYSNNFEVDTTASWNVNKNPATTDEAHNFFFDYSTVGIPAAPSGAGTHGVKLQANQSSAVFGGVSVSPTGYQNTMADYKVKFDWWANFNGPAPVGGSGSTQLSTFGVGTSGTTAQWPGGAQDSIWFGGTGDGNSSSDWRAYSPSNGGQTSYPAGTAISNPIYAAPFIATFDNRNNNHAYYSGFGLDSAPAAQTLLFPQQTGVSIVGSAAFEWHQVEIEKLGANVTWKVDGLLIATVPAAHDTVVAGSNFFLGHSDTNATSSTDPNDVNLLFTLIDNVQVIPEPTSLSLLGLSALGLLARRRVGR